MSRVSFAWESSCLAAFAFCLAGPAAAQTYTTFTVSGAVSTAAAAINPKGTVTGSYTDSHGKAHGFVRTPDGTITSFDPQGSSATQPSGMPPARL